MEYVTYDENGNLTGSYLQDLLPEHEGVHIEVDDAQRAAWTTFRANNTRDGLELIGPVVAPAPTIDDLAAVYVIAVQGELDRVARSFGYDSLAVAVTYAEEPAVPKFQAEAQALRGWRSLVWAACYAMLADVRAGTVPVPTEGGVLAALPVAPVQGDLV